MNFASRPPPSATWKEFGTTPLSIGGLAQAGRYTDRLFEVFDELAADPRGARSIVCDTIRVGYRRRSIERHIVFFRPTKYGIAIIRILHERMDASRHFA